MSGRIARARAECKHRLPVTLTRYAACNSAMPVVYTKTRKLMTMNGLVQLRLQIRSCPNSDCERFHTVCRPVSEGSWALPEQEFGGCVRMAASAFTRKHIVTQKMLADVPDTNWRRERASLERRRQSRCLRFRFRKNPADYLAELEKKGDKLNVPS